MSQPAICSGVAGWPRPSRSWAAAPRGRARNHATAIHSPGVLHGGIGDLPALGDLPCLDGVVVIDVVLSPHVEELLACRLDIARLVGRAAGQGGRASVPPPGPPDAGQALRKDRRP